MPYWKPKIPDSAQTIYVDIGELYRNVPANVTQEKDWKQWEDTYQGRCIKEKGDLMELVFIHRRANCFLLSPLLVEKAWSKIDRDR